MNAPASHTGLSAAKVAQRLAAGQVNRVRRSDAAEYADIARRNLLTLFNALVVPAALALIALGDYNAGLAVSGMAITNTLFGLVQEIRAKRHLDRLTLLSEARVRVLRDGQMQEILAGDVVQDDLLLLAAGDAIVADGAVVEERFLEVDEALLTGESDPVPRREGEEVLSGSFCVAGEGIYRADRIGMASFAQKTAAEARSYRYTASPMQQSIDQLIRVLSLLAVILSASYVGLYFLHRTLPTAELVRMVAATITSMVPQGLVLMATLAFLLGAVRMTARGALVNRLTAVEAMASIDTLCMDKTGTLTTNHLHLAEVRFLGSSEEEESVRLRLRLFASCSLDRDSKNLTAIRTALGDAAGDLIDQLPFKSQNRYSAVRVRAEGNEHVLAMGAAEALRPLLASGTAWEEAWRELMATGLRVLLFTEVVEAPRPTFAGSLDGHSLRPVALLGLSDEIRPGVAEVLRHLAEQGIVFRIISGDNAETVRATVAPLGEKSALPALAALANDPVVTGTELDAVSNGEELIDSRSVFGRVSPWQKVQIVRSLQARGRHTAMIGDGVNDVLPIKNAQLGIAMADGSRASKTVAGIVLQGNDFGLLPQVLDEGRTIVRNLRRAGKLFLTKNAFTLVLIVGALGVFGLPFPFAPQQVTLLNFLTIGIPALLITLDRNSARTRVKREYVREVGWFAVHTGTISGLTALGLMLVSNRLWHEDVRMQRTLVLAVLILLGMATLWRALADGGSSDGDWLLRWLPVAMLPVFLVGMYVPAVASFLELERLDGAHWLWVLATAGIGVALMLLSDWMRK